MSTRRVSAFAKIFDNSRFIRGSLPPCARGSFATASSARSLSIVAAIPSFDNTAGTTVSVCRHNAAMTWSAVSSGLLFEVADCMAAAIASLVFVVHFFGSNAMTYSSSSKMLGFLPNTAIA